MSRRDFAPRGLAQDVPNEFKVESDAVRLWLSEDERVARVTFGFKESKSGSSRYFNGIEVSDSLVASTFIKF
jgi:hypothetical protein